MVCLFLFVVVWFAFDNRKGSIELLGENRSHNLVREGHLRERYFAVCSCVDRIREAVRATNHQHQASHATIHSFLHPLCKSHTAHLLASLVEQYHIVARSNILEQHLAFSCLLLLFRQILRISQIG